MKQTAVKELVDKMKQTDDKVDLFAYSLGLKDGAKWQAEQNQEAINKLISIIEWYDDESDVRPDAETFMWFEQFKKK